MQRLAAEQHVLRRRHVRYEGELLMDYRDASALGVTHGTELGDRPVQTDAPGV